MTERLYILGHPVAHSKSPAMHNAAYRALNLDWEYGFADCADEPQARAFLARRDWLALNVTMPYKPLALRRATWRSEAALLAQGANVVARRGDELLADNTDGTGCVSYLKRCGARFDGARVVVCGTGPTSLAIMHAAAVAGAREVALLGRHAARAAAALDGYRARESSQGGRAGGGPSGAGAAADLKAGAYASSPELIARADIIVDATPLGMNPNDPAPFDTALLSAGQVVFDVVYGHGTTALVAAARAAGCAAHDGAGMLVAQAVETVRDLVSWLDLPVDADAHDLFGIMSRAAGF